MIGTRLGVICESLALSFFGIIFGCIISWQLALIVLAALVGMALLTSAEVTLRMWQSRKNGRLMELASTVRSYFNRQKSFLRKIILS